MNLPIFTLEEYLGKHEFSAKYLLCSSDAESFSMSEILEKAAPEELKLWNELRLGYTEVPGLPQLREAIATELYPNLIAKNIFCFAGAEEGIFCALHALIESDDHVIVLSPCYQSLLEIPKSKGAEITEIELLPSQQWQIDLVAIEKNIRPNTKCIVINFPHNPTGQVIEQHELQQLIALCERHDIWLFSDEVYRLLGTPKNPWADPAATLYDKALSLGVMSKAFGLAGLRVGWIACQNTELLEKMARIKHYTSICNSAPAEIISLMVLRNKEYYLNRNNKIVQDNLKVLDGFFNHYAETFSWVRPQGGCVGFVNYHRNESVDDFCERFLREKSVLLMPASVYNYPSNYFRLGFGRKSMVESLQPLVEWLQST